MNTFILTICYHKLAAADLYAIIFGFDFISTFNRNANMAKTILCVIFRQQIVTIITQIESRSIHTHTVSDHFFVEYFVLIFIYVASVCGNVDMLKIMPKPIENHNKFPKCLMTGQNIVLPNCWLSCRRKSIHFI